MSWTLITHLLAGGGGLFTGYVVPVLYRKAQAAWTSFRAAK